MNNREPSKQTLHCDRKCGIFACWRESRVMRFWLPVSISEYSLSLLVLSDIFDRKRTFTSRSPRRYCVRGLGKFGISVLRQVIEGGSCPTDFPPPNLIFFQVSTIRLKGTRDFAGITVSISSGASSQGGLE